MRCAAATMARTVWACCINTILSSENIGMQKLNAPSTATQSSVSSAGTHDVMEKTAPGSEPPPVPSSAAAATKTTPAQIVLIVLGVIAFLCFARQRTSLPMSRQHFISGAK
jgi:hypothetical protein